MYPPNVWRPIATSILKEVPKPLPVPSNMEAMELPDTVDPVLDALHGPPAGLGSHEVSAVPKSKAASPVLTPLDSFRLFISCASKLPPNFKVCFESCLVTFICTVLEVRVKVLNPP